jgi:heme exporter protein A
MAGTAMPKKAFPLLSVDSLSVFRDHTPILTSISLTLGAGQWIVVRGRNGSGKSTLLKTIVGLIPPTHGNITRSDCCYLGHQNGLREHLTVGEHLAFVAQHFRVPSQATPLDPFKDIPLYQLSAGLKRQVALCQFILTPHKLWFLDEPFEHLDPQAYAYFLSLMRHHIEQGGAILMTSHETLHLPEIEEMWLS